MDKARMIAEIASRHGIRLDPDDPAFLLVELNMMAFEDGAGALAKWRDDVAVLVGSLERGSRQWEEKATSIARSIFDDQKRDFVEDTNRLKGEHLRDIRAEINAVFGAALGPAAQRLNEAAAQASGKRTVLWAVIGALVGGVVACTGTLYFAHHAF